MAGDSTIRAGRRPLARPLSPHLGIYRWRATMAMSILHRITGVGLYGGLFLLALWLLLAAFAPAAFAAVTDFLGTWFGVLILTGLLFTLLQHFFGGIRHFIWDFGVGLGRPTRDALAVGTIVAAALTTVLVLALAVF